MAKIDPKKMYLSIKNGYTLYKDDIHCPMVLDVMNNEGTLVAFCAKALICESTFYKWCKDYPEFGRCYQLGKAISKANWEAEGEHGKDDGDFNLDYWRLVGARRYGLGRQQDRIRLDIDPSASPYEQYKQLISQASGGDFTASEIKQVMESINVGRGAFETFKMQEDIDRMQHDVNRMKTNNANHCSSIASTTETD